MLVALQQQLKFDQLNFRISKLYQLEVLLFDQLMGDHILSLDPWQRFTGEKKRGLLDKMQQQK